MTTTKTKSQRHTIFRRKRTKPAGTRQLLTRRAFFEQLESRELLAGDGWNEITINNQFHDGTGQSIRNGDRLTTGVADNSGLLGRFEILENGIRTGQAPKGELPGLTANRESGLAVRSYIFQNGERRAQDVGMDLPNGVEASYFDFAILGANERLTPVPHNGVSSQQICVFYKDPTRLDSDGMCGESGNNTSKRRVAVKLDELSSGMTFDLTQGVNNRKGGPENIDDIHYFVPRFVINGGAGLTVHEAGATDTFTVNLAASPTMYTNFQRNFNVPSLPQSGNVTVRLSSSDSTEFAVQPSQLTFNTANWSIPQTVTVRGLDDTIDDGDVAGVIKVAVDNSSFHLYRGLSDQIAVTNVDNDPQDRPPVADAGGRYSADEGDAIRLDASGSHDPDPSTGTLRFDWDFNGDGRYDDASGMSPVFSAAQLDGPSSVTVGLRVKDNTGLSATDTATIDVINVAPIADAGGPYDVLQGDSVRLAGSTTDPGIPDTHSFAWDLDGDGMFGEIGGAAARGDEVGRAPVFQSAGIAAPRAWTVSLRVTDDDLGVDTDSAVVQVNPSPASIAGYKFEDTDGDGRDNDSDADGIGDEPRWEDVTITLSGDGDGDGRQDSRSTTTNASGAYRFDDLWPGTYTVTETPPPGSIATTPVSHTLTIRSGEQHVAAASLATGSRGDTIVDPQLAFGNVLLGSIQGEKFFDQDADGHRDPNEPGMRDVVIFLDLNDSGVREFDEPFVHTDANGGYAFRDLIASTYTVAEESPHEFVQSFPANGQPHRVDLRPGEDATGTDFGNTLGVNFINIPFGEVQGEKFHDLNGDGVRDPGEPGLGGVFIYLDADGDGRHDDEEPSTVTAFDDPTTTEDETGQFLFEKVTPGAYKLLEIPPGGSYQTFPGPEGHEILVRPGRREEGLLFGNAFFGSIAGSKFNDFNGNGVHDVNEPGVPRIAIFLDLDRDGAYDAGEPVTWTMEDDPATTEDETGDYRLEDVKPGSYVIREVLPEGVLQTLPGGALQGYEVTLISGEGLTDFDFGNAHNCSVHGWKWNDLNLNGRFDPGEGVAGVTIFADQNSNGVLDSGEISTETMVDNPDTPRDETGLYELNGLPPGEHVIQEVVPDDTFNAFPGPEGHLVVLQACGDIGPSPMDLTEPQPRAPMGSHDDGAAVPPVARGNPIPGAKPPIALPVDAIDAEPLIPVTKQIASPVVEAPVNSTGSVLHVWHNDLQAEDVDGSRTIEPIDVLIIINLQDSLGSHSFDTITPPLSYYPDTSNDNWLSPLDALIVINALNTATDETGATLDPVAKPTWLITVPTARIQTTSHVDSWRDQWDANELADEPTVGPAEAAIAIVSAYLPSKLREAHVDELLGAELLDDLLMSLDDFWTTL